jgi:hypothetical protein
MGDFRRERRDWMVENIPPSNHLHIERDFSDWVIVMIGKG